jgi:hypothetical protein
MPRATLAVFALVTTLVACGGSPPPEEEAPLPDAWVEQDQGGTDTQSITLGEPASPGRRQAAPGDPAAANAEQQARGELQQEMRGAWAGREPGHPRAQSVCMARVRIATLARRWIDAYGRAYPQLPQDPDEVTETLSEIERWCTSRETRDNPELVEGAFQGLAAELDERVTAL